MTYLLVSTCGSLQIRDHLPLLEVPNSNAAVLRSTAIVCLSAPTYCQGTAVGRNGNCLHFFGVSRQRVDEFSACNLKHQNSVLSCYDKGLVVGGEIDGVDPR